MRRFEAKELRRFLQAVDDQLSEPHTLLIIGGSAALLAYGVQRVTKDIDTWDDTYRAITSSLDAARVATGLFIPIECPGVHDGPYHFESRLQRVPFEGLQYLTLKVPEKHDLVLMKMVRGEEGDLQVAEEIHAAHGLKLDILTGRYIEEMRHVIGQPERLDMNFLALVERLYGDDGLEPAQRRLRKRQ